MENKLAPIIIFAYNRVEHLKKTVDCLKINEGASDSICYIFSDGPKDIEAQVGVKEVREYIRGIQYSCFKKVILIESVNNKGLAQSIIEGVSHVLGIHGKAIVVEDDVLTSRYFLKFMNEALDYYQTNNMVWSIGGYTVPLDLPKNYPYEVIATQRCSSYCWGTWKDRWDKIDWQIKDYKYFRFNMLQRRKFNRFGNDRSLMLDDQKNGLINSWAIRFDYNMWKNGKLNILPVHSLANNIGHDGSGTHSRVQDYNDIFFVEEMYKKIPKLENVSFSNSIISAYVRFFNMPITHRIKRFCGNVYRSIKN